MAKAPNVGRNLKSGPTPRRKSRGDIKATVLGTDPLRDYQSTKVGYYGEMFVQNLPAWRLWTGRMMLTSDPLVNFSLNVRNAALMPAEVVVKAKNPQVQKWVQEQWDYLWNQHRSKLVSAKKWGFAPLQVLWKERDGLLVISGCRDFAPEDGRALVKGWDQVGMSIKGKKVYCPQALWLTFGAEFSSPYGTGCLRRSYPAWYEKWMDHGAKRLLQLRMIKDSYIGDIFWYPPHMLAELPDGTKMPWRDLMRELGENRLSGGALTLPRMVDEKGNLLTDYQPPQDIGGGSQIFEWVDHCDDGIMRGADVPMEVVQAADTGSGYSGRSIPFLVVLSVCTQELTEIVHNVDRQCLRPAAWLNWGGDVEYTIVAKSLVESFSDDASGSPMGGEAVGGQPSTQAQPQQIPQQPQQGVQFGEDDKPKYSYASFDLTGQLAFDIVQLSARIPSSDLQPTDFGDATDTGRELNPHITVKYGLHDNDPESVRLAIQKCGPVAIQVGKCSHFKAEEYDVVKLEVVSDSLRALNKAICNGTKFTDTYPDYNPHITVAYVKKGLGPVWASRLNDLQGKVAVFDYLTFSNHDKVRTTIGLVGQAQFAEASSVDFGKDSKPLHAPPKGVNIHGVDYKGGEFIPKEVINALSPAEQSQLRAGTIARHIKNRPELSSEAKNKTDRESEKHSEIGLRFGIPASAVKDILSTDVKELRRRDDYMAPVNNQEAPVKDYEDFPVDTAKIDSYGDPKNSYVQFLREVDPKQLLTSEHEDGIKKTGAYQKYVGWAKEGHKAPPINVNESDDGKLIASNRRRTLAAQEAGVTSMKVWFSPVNKETNNPLKYGDILEAANASQHSEGGIPSNGESFQFEEESEAIRKLREFVQRGTAAKLKLARERINELTQTELGSQTLAGVIEHEITALQPLLQHELEVGMYAARVRGMAEIIAEALTPATLAAAPPSKPPSVAEALFPEGSPPEVRFPVLEDALRVLERSPAAAGIDYRETALKVRQGAFAVTTDLADNAVGDIRTVLSEVMREGGDRHDFIKRIQERFEQGGPFTEAHLETVFRTNVMSALSDGRMRAMEQPLVSDAFPYAAISAAHDARVRPEHKELEKLGLQETNIYRADDPTFRKFRSPWSYNCRCSWTPVTVEQAARKGVQEAVEWLERAKNMATVEGGSFYQYLDAVKPLSPTFVTPPPFEPEPEFRREI